MRQKQKRSLFWHESYLLKPEVKKFYSTSPGAPSLGECKVIEKFIAQKKKKSKILILGATPRYRDLAHRLKAEVTCVDISLNMLQSMISLMRNKNKAEEEIWVRSDWLKMPLAENYWDFVLGDLVICNVPYKLWNKFFKKIKEILSPNGFFITRVFRMYKSVKDKKKVFLNILKKFRGKIEYKNIYYLLWELNLAVYDSKTHQRSTTLIHKIASQAIKNLSDKSLKKDLNQLVKKLKDVIPPGKIWYGTDKKDLERKFKKFFKIVTIKYGTGHPYIETCPIYFLKKR